MELSWKPALSALGLVDPAAIDALKSAAEVKLFAEGSTVIAQDEDEDHVYILLSGRARVVLLSENGQEIWLDQFEPGAVVGELAALTGHRRTSEIIAELPSMLAIFPSATFFDLVRRHGELGMCLARILAGRVHHTTQRMFELSALSAPGRVYAEILRMAAPSPDGHYRVIEPTPSLTAIAGRINTTRETVSRTISDLERRGLLERSDTGFRLVDPDRLDRLQSLS